jgi:hypothetical protein
MIPFLPPSFLLGMAVEVVTGVSAEFWEEGGSAPFVLFPVFLSTISLVYFFLETSSPRSFPILFVSWVTVDFGVMLVSKLVRMSL